MSVVVVTVVRGGGDGGSDESYVRIPAVYTERVLSGAATRILLNA